MNAQEFSESKYMAKMSEILVEVDKNPSGIAKSRVRGWLEQLTDLIKSDLKIPSTPLVDITLPQTPPSVQNSQTNDPGSVNGTNRINHNGKELESDPRIVLLEEQVLKMSRFLSGKMGFNFDHKNKMKEKKKAEKSKKVSNVQKSMVDAHQQLELQRELIESQRNQINNLYQSNSRFQWKRNFNRDKPRYHERSNYNHERSNYYRDYPPLAPILNQTYHPATVTEASPRMYQSQYQNQNYQTNN